ncbi:MAG TPA: hypothetical protein VHK70_06700 [Burkholderiaceae bacterium]|jgi:hypothetical protein|nr:hypothetical protein [Burkholderiaceae bacterium]
MNDSSCITEVVSVAPPFMQAGYPWRKPALPVHCRIRQRSLQPLSPLAELNGIEPVAALPPQQKDACNYRVYSKHVYQNFALRKIDICLPKKRKVSNAKMQEI